MGARAKEVDERIKAALKAGHAEELSTLRLAKAELSNKRVELKVPNTSDLDDDVVLEILRSMVKKREKAIDLFEQGGRKDLADKERGEIRILQGLLPQEVTGEALRSLVTAVIGEVGATTPRDMGKVMAALKGRPGVNASAASPIVKELLSPK